jgi:DNA-binding XRE family transcriptional regulator
MARLSEEDRSKILADFHIGKSQNELAKIYRCSPATINKLCKGLEPKYKEKVNIVSSIKAELVNESEYQSECFENAVAEAIRNKGLVFGLTQKALKKAEQMLDNADNINDVKAVVELSDRASLTLGVNPRFAPKTEITNTNAQEKKNTIIQIIEDKQNV